MSKTALNSHAEIISAIINHKANLSFAQHLLNGKVDEKHILANIDYVETGYLVPNDTQTGFLAKPFMDAITHAINTLDGSALIDIVKECRRYTPFNTELYFIFDKAFTDVGLVGLVSNQILIGDIPLTVGIASHTKLSEEAALTKAEMAFTLLQSSPIVLQTRKKHRRVFESILLAHPGAQKKIIESTLGYHWVGALERTQEEGRYKLLHDYLTALAKKPDELKAKSKAGTEKMVTMMKEMHKTTPESATIASDMINQITGTDFSRPGPSPAGNMPVKENNSPQETNDMKTPFIQFTGTAHLLGNFMIHGQTELEELDILTKIVCTPHDGAGTLPLITNALSFIHRSEFQEAICKQVLGVHHDLTTSPTERGIKITKVVETQVNLWTDHGSSRYKGNNVQRNVIDQLGMFGAVGINPTPQVQENECGCPLCHESPETLELNNPRYDFSGMIKFLTERYGKEQLKPMGEKEELDAQLFIKVLEGLTKAKPQDIYGTDTGFKQIEEICPCPDCVNERIEESALRKMREGSEPQVIVIELDESLDDQASMRIVEDARTEWFAKMFGITADLIAPQKQVMKEMPNTRDLLSKFSHKDGTIDILALVQYANRPRPKATKATVTTSEISTVHVSSFDVHGVDGEIINTFKMRFDEDDNNLRISGSDGRVVFHAVVESLIDAKYVFRNFKKGVPQKAAVRSAHFACIRVGGKVL